MPVDAYTKTLLHFDGSDASTTFFDTSVDGYWTKSGNVQIDTDQSVFGGASGLFDGAADYIYRGADINFSFGTGDWTIDFWIRRNGTVQYPGIITATNGGGNGWSIHLGNSDNKVRVIWANTQKILSTNTISDLTWTHVAVVRYGDTVTCYINGADNGTDDCTGDSIDCTSTYINIGRTFADTLNYYWNGWIDELRVVKGLAMFRSAFTVPTRQYPTYTNYLTHRGRDRVRIRGVSLG